MFRCQFDYKIGIIRTYCLKMSLNCLYPIFVISIALSAFAQAQSFPANEEGMPCRVKIVFQNFSENSIENLSSLRISGHNPPKKVFKL